MKTNALQTRQIVSTTSLRDAVWISEANTAMSTAHIKHRSRQRLYEVLGGLQFPVMPPKFGRLLELQEYPNAYIWMWRKMVLARAALMIQLTYSSTIKSL
ncbi:hypothetical protein [Xanthomonas hortorum]|uniref:hypothetical protein n=1 Tax=Xanthomonas hortorum TaxID=56454 RepID=UPI0015935B00|nr:hypothetical protein [Xanthomonas hortorum]NHF66176.1 hypothetical protein [Xanthomonas hortorum]